MSYREPAAVGLADGESLGVPHQTEGEAPPTGPPGRGGRGKLRGGVAMGHGGQGVLGWHGRHQWGVQRGHGHQNGDSFKK